MADPASPDRPDPIQPGTLPDAVWTALVILTGFAVYAWHCAPTVQYWDAAERTLVAWQMGLSHPTGCILHAVLCKVLMTIVPLAPEYVANLTSALASALALGVAYRIARRFSADRPLCAAATLVLGTSALYWSQAIYSEVYAPHFFFFALFMLYYVRWLDETRPRDLVTAAFIYALGLGVHMSHVLLAPWILIGVVWRDRTIFRSPKTLAAIAGAALLGMTWIAGIIIRGKTYWLIGTSARPDSLPNLVDFLSGAQFAWAREQPTAQFLKRVAGCIALLFYSFLGVGALIALWGWIRTLRRYAPLAILAAAGTISYILYFSDNSSSDVGTLILPCSLFVFICFVVAWDRWRSAPGRRVPAIAVVAALAATQFVLFPILSRTAQHQARLIGETGVTIDDAGTASALFWEGVLKANVTQRGNLEPLLQSKRLAQMIDRFPAPRAFIVPWEVQTVLAWYQAKEGWPSDTRLYEIINQHRFYRPESGAEAEIIEDWRDVIKKYAGKRTVLLLNREPQIGTDADRKPIGKIWFEQQYYYLFEILPPQ